MFHPSREEDSSPPRFIPARRFSRPLTTRLSNDFYKLVDRNRHWCKKYVEQTFPRKSSNEIRQLVYEIEKDVLNYWGQPATMTPLLPALSLLTIAHRLQRSGTERDLFIHSLKALGQQHLTLAFIATPADFRSKIPQVGISDLGIEWYQECIGCVSVARAIFAFRSCGLPIWFPECVDDVKYKIDLICGPVGFPALVLGVQIKSALQRVQPDFRIVFRRPTANPISDDSYETGLLYEGVRQYNERYHTQFLPAFFRTGFRAFPPEKVESCRELHSLVLETLKRDIPFNWDTIREARWQPVTRRAL